MAIECDGPSNIIRQVPYADLSDEDLVSAYRAAPVANREPIADELFRRHFERVARWCFRFTGDRDAAADLAQDVFLKAHRHLDAFKGLSRFSTWLYTITRNEALNRLQRPSPVMDPDDVLAQLPGSFEDPAHGLERRSRGHRVMQFVAATLDPTEREVFTMHYGDEVPLDVITRVLGLQNASGAKAYIVSARRKLARAVERLRLRGEEL
jgi:RNA polymerase sigma-70 factor, ECF subfamily